MTVDGGNANFSTREGAPFQERLIIGLIYLCTAIIFLILQISVIFVFCIYKDLRNHQCYRIMLFIAIADILQLLVHAYGGIICLLDNSLNFYIEKLAGGIANTFSLINWPICFVLALNRLLVFLPTKLDEKKVERLFNWLIALSLIHGLPFFILYITPYSTLGFRYYNWDYIRVDIYEAENLEWVETSSESLPLPYVVLTFIVYLAIFCILMHQRRKMTFNLMQKPEQASRRISAVVHISSPKFNNFQPYTQQQINQQIMLSNKLQQHQQQRLSIQSRISIQHDLIPQSLIQHERRLLIQAVIQFFIEFSLSSIWFLQMIDCLPDGLLTNVLANWYWIFYNGFRPLVYLAMNKTIRQRIISLWLNRQLESTAEFAKIPRVIPQEIRVTARPIPLVNEPI